MGASLPSIFKTVKSWSLKTIFERPMHWRDRDLTFGGPPLFLEQVKKWKYEPK